jgi:protocatechuate 3,4-dioxygenase beta subunit
MMIASPALALAACGGVASADSAATPTSPSSAVQPTPACSDGDDEPTPSETEGPYFKPNSPERASLLESGLGGTRLTVQGRVLSTACAPIAGALLDFWQADDSGNYDNAGFRLRGHQYTDASGRFTLETIVPGLYPGRTRHVHVKAQAPNGPIVTTQLYFPNRVSQPVRRPVHVGAPDDDRGPGRRETRHVQFRASHVNPPRPLPSTRVSVPEDGV